jgi:DNA-binding response OmpR family regulator
MKDGKYVILCVDDDLDILQTLRMLLEKNDYLVHEAGSAAEAADRFPEINPDLMIVDLMMEQVDAGTSLVQKLRAMGAKMPLYLLSSVGDELAATLPPAELGLSGVFQKPIEPKVLLQTLRARLKPVAA